MLVDERGAERAGQVIVVKRLAMIFGVQVAFGVGFLDFSPRRRAGFGGCAVAVRRVSGKYQGSDFRAESQKVGGDPLILL